MVNLSYRVYIRNSLYQRVGELNDWITLEFVTRFNGVGTWVLEVDKDSYEGSLLYKTGGIIIVQTNLDDNTHAVIFSGYVATEYSRTNNVLRAAGYSDEGVLSAAKTRPTPSQVNAPFNNEYFVQTGLASTVMRSLVSKNIGPEAPSFWKIPILTLQPDPALGGTVTVRTRLDPLITMLSSLAVSPIAGGLGFKLQQSDLDANNLVFNVYEPNNRSETVKFSVPLETISDYEDVIQLPSYNYAYVMGGDGFGTNRTIVEGYDADAVAEWGRVIPIVIDKRGTDNTGELNQALAEALAGTVTLRRTKVVPFEVSTLLFGIDYNIGDLVTVATPSGDQIQAITEIQFSLNADQGAQITPVIGRGDGEFESNIVDHIASVSNRIGNIERNWNVPDNSIIEDMLHTTMRWYVGDAKITSRPSAQPGWLICNGDAISRSVYSRLFADIGTLHGPGNGSTTFNLPDMRDRFPMGTGTTHGLGTTGGAEQSSFIIPIHSHPHAHGMEHIHEHDEHTHPGSHSHGINYSHSHTVPDHGHKYSIDHDHEDIDITTTEETNIDTDLFGRTAGSTTGTSHRHQIQDLTIEYNSPDKDSEEQTGVVTGASGSDTTTDPDSNVFNADWDASPTEADPTSTEDDTTTGGGFTGTVSIVPKYVVWNYEIYTGVVI